MNILIAGNKGFIGKNLYSRLIEREDIIVTNFDKGINIEEIENCIAKIDFIFFFIGIMRPLKIKEFYDINVGILKKFIKIISEKKLKIPILFTSSIQAELDNDYGKSKLIAEKLLKEYSDKNNVPVYIYRLTNTFGKYALPNSSSVIATWCHNIVQDKEIYISDRNKIIHLMYIDDLISIFEMHLKDIKRFRCYELKPIYSKKLGEILDYILEFKNNKVNNLNDEFRIKLYKTYNWYFLNYYQNKLEI